MTQHQARERDVTPKLNSTALSTPHKFSVNATNLLMPGVCRFLFPHGTPRRSQAVCVRVHRMKENEDTETEPLRM